MSRTKEAHWGCRLAYGVLAVILVFILGLFTEHFSMVSHAQSQGKVTANVNIRKEANGSSEILGSAMKDATVTINHQMQAPDGTIWYQVFVDSETLGYIRSDLVQITDGTTPPTEEAGTTTTTTTTTVATPAPSAVNETPAQVEALNPVSASVTGSQAVRVRSNASTTSQIITTVQSGMALTVTGRANGTDSKVWYQVKFVANGAEVVGFIRSDYVSVSGELEPYAGEEPVVETETPTEPQEPAEPAEVKDYETLFQNDTWYLRDNINGYDYEIQKIFDVGTSNKQLYEEEHKKVESQKAAIIIIVILMVFMASAIAYLVFKIKDMRDSAYFSQVEKETLRRRENERAQGANQKVMHTVGVEKKRPNGASPASGGARPTGQKRPDGAVPVSGGAKPSGQKPPSGEMPAQTGARPAGQKRPDVVAPATENHAPNPGWKSKNFMQDDDEFEFEFLNWDGEEEI